MESPDARRRHAGGVSASDDVLDEHSEPAKGKASGHQPPTGDGESKPTEAAQQD